ncbi:MAG: ABC transporter, partial [Microbacterium sp.]|nr:ABC transporter [Microbacterium sp.]
MTTTAPDQTDPTPHRLSTPRALARLIPFAKPVLPRLALGAVSALGASILALMIPLILEEVVRGPIASGSTVLIAWGAAAILGLGLAEALMVWLRRWFVLAPATLMEYDIRQTFYSRLQRLPVAFHDRWQSGQLLSRMMQDISML